MWGGTRREAALCVTSLAFGAGLLRHLEAHLLPPHSLPWLSHDLGAASWSSHKWVHSLTSSSQAPFLRTCEPSDLGWSGLGPAGIDFDSGVGFPEQIYRAGSIAKGLRPSREGSEGVISSTTGAPSFLELLETPLGILTSLSQTLINLHSLPDCYALQAL